MGFVNLEELTLTYMFIWIQIMQDQKIIRRVHVRHVSFRVLSCVMTMQHANFNNLSIVEAGAYPLDLSVLKFYGCNIP